MSLQRGFINLVTEDLERAQRLYTALFGFEVVFSSDWFVHLRAPDEPTLELGLLRAGHEVVPAKCSERPIGGLLTLVVDDVDAVHARALEHGVKVVEAPRDLFYGQRRMVIEDADGMLVDVSSACAPDPQWLKRVEATPEGGHVERPASD